MWVYNLLIATLQWRRSHRLCPPKADTPSFKLSLSKFNPDLIQCVINFTKSNLIQNLAILAYSFSLAVRGDDHASINKRTIIAY